MLVGGFAGGQPSVQDGVGASVGKEKSGLELEA